ncbi:hypothetical protein C8R43DRAFT_946074 [Mycena crocata]|nr:hypothetical protein C8R43DRAFT_946074 [Mycena crocata]
MSKSFDCSCKLKPNKHQVPVTERTKHKKALRDLEALERKDIAENEQPPSQLSAFEMGDLLTALTMTDEGPNLASQPSKLFTSRQEFQEDRASHIPAEFNAAAVSLSEASRSIQAIYNARRSVPARREPRNTRLDIEVAVEVQRRASEAEASLAVSVDFDPDNPVAVAQLRELVEAASTVFRTCKRSLEKTKSDSDEKKRALEAVKTLNMKIDFIGSTLPEETTPLFYDACMLFLIILTRSSRLLVRSSYY